MTDKGPRRKAVAKAAPAKDQSAESGTITIPVHMDASIEELTRKMEQSVPEWRELAQPDRQQLVDLIMATRKMPDPVQIKLVRRDDGSVMIEHVGKSAMLAVLKLQNTFAAPSMDPVTARLTELRSYMTSVGITDDQRINAALCYVESMEPKTQAEALLLLQSYITHDAAIRAMAQLGNADWMPNIQIYGNLGVKLMRTFQGQMDTLTKMRSGGEQVVRHIYIDNRNGGQTVVADKVTTTSGGGQNARNLEQAHAVGGGPAMLGHDPHGQGVPIASGQGQETMQDARRR